MKLDFQHISTIVGISSQELKSRYESWSEKKRNSGRKTNIVDMKLLSALSGLSVSSVSNYVNNRKGSLSKEKQQILSNLTEAIGYIPSNAAKKLRSTQKMSIGFVFSVTSGTSMEYYVDILKGVKKEADKYGYFIDIYDIVEEKRKDFFAELPFLGLVDGLIIVASVVTAEQLTPLLKRNIPVVVINPKTDVSSPPVTAGIYSSLDEFSHLLDHLFLDHKYKNPILISVELEQSIQRKLKFNLYKEALERAQIPFDETKNVTFISAHSFSEGTRAYELSREKNPDADVYICLTDTLAIPIIRGLEKENKSTAVTGFANFEIAPVFGLTTVEQNIQKHGYSAFQHLFFSMQYIQRNAHFPEYVKEEISGEFVKRQSCGCQ